MRPKLKEGDSSLWDLEVPQRLTQGVVEQGEPTTCQRFAVLLALGWFDSHYRCPFPDEEEWRKDAEAETWCAVLENSIPYRVPSWLSGYQVLFCIQLWSAFWLASKAYNALRRWARWEFKEAQHARIIYWDDETGSEKEMEFLDQHSLEEWEHLETKIFWEQMWTYLNSVLDVQDKILVDGLVEGKSQQEIANELGVTQSAVAHRLRRIRKRAKEFLDG